MGLLKGCGAVVVVFMIYMLLFPSSTFSGLISILNENERMGYSPTFPDVGQPSTLSFHVEITM